MKKGNFILMSVLLGACSHVNVSHHPLSQPSASPTPKPLQHVQLNIQISDSDTLDPIANAKVRVKTPLDEPQDALSDSDGLAMQGGVRHQVPVQIQVDAEGYLPVLRQFHLQPVSKQDSLSIDIPLQKALAHISGIVLDQRGAPIPQTVIFDGSQSVLSDAEGRFQLYYKQDTSLYLSAYKQGYAPAKAPVEVSKVTDLTMTLPPLTPKALGIYEGHGHLGMEQDAFRTAFETVGQWLSQEGFQWQFLETLNLAHIETLWMIAPDQGFSEKEINTILDFVEKGGKLIVFGEWAGFSGIHIQGLNQLLGPLGFRFETDALRSPSGSVIDVFFESSPYLEGLSHVQFINSGSLTCTQVAQCKILGRSNYQSFQIKNQSSYGVLAQALFGLGQVWVAGDSSFVLRSKHPDQKNHFDHGDHRALLKSLLNS